MQTFTLSSLILPDIHTELGKTVAEVDNGKADM